MPSAPFQRAFAPILDAYHLRKRVKEKAFINDNSEYNKCVITETIWDHLFLQKNS